MASRPTAGRVVHGLSDRLSARPRTSQLTVRRTGRRIAGASAAASCRQNISTYAPITCATREYKPDILIRHIPLVMVRRLCKQIFLHDLL